MEKYIVVFGGCSLDITYNQNEDLTYPAEPSFLMPGGKGANQAVAASRAGYNVKMISVIGNDSIGKEIKKNLEDNKVDTTHIRVIDGIKSDNSIVRVSVNGDNEIFRNKEAINRFDTSLIYDNAELIKNAQYVLLQSKMKRELYIELINFCYENDVKTVLTPCPSKDLTIKNIENRELLSKVTIITANEDESKDICQTENLDDILDIMPNIVMTLGAKGVCFVNEKGEKDHIKALEPRKLVDTTGAGDTLCGNMVVALLKGYSKRDAVKIGVKASTLKLEKMGAQTGMPYAENLILKKER